MAAAVPDALPLPKRLWRAALNPAAVFGRSGRPVGGPGLPVRVVGAVTEPGEHPARWYMPNLPTWAFADAAEQCRVISAAVKRYGEVESPRASAPLAALTEEAAAARTLHAPPCVERAFEAEALDGSLAFAALSLDGYDYAAVPIAYVLRRYEKAHVAWRQSTNGLLSAWSCPAETLLSESGRSAPAALIAPCRIRGEAPPL